MKNKTTAAILAFVLGGVGAHRFYLGQSGLGIIYLLFCWTFIPAIVAFVDFLVLLTTDDDAFNVKYNNGIPVSAGASHNVSAQVVSPSSNVAEELEKLHELKQKGILTDEEFQAKKVKLLQ